MTNLIGQSLGRYHILEQLGEGGMATVYKAYDTRLERDVAIKIIRRGAFPPDHLENMLKRFEREAKSLAKLSHPNIVKVLDFGEHEDSPYLVMEYFPGGTLKRLLGKPIPWQDAVRLLLPIAQALEYAHRHNIIHRDIKPANILLTESGQPMLTDFGIAKILETDETATLTGTGVGVGTPEYMAPEQWTGQTTPQSDIYSLGVVFYEMVTGRKPYVADTPAAILLKQASDPLPRPAQFVPDLPDAVEKILIKALAKNVEDRYPTIVECADALEQLGYQGEKTASTKQTTITTKVSPSRQKQITGPEEKTEEILPSVHEEKPVHAPRKKKSGWMWAVGVVGVICLLAVSIPIISWASNLLTATATAAIAPDVQTVKPPPAVPVTITFWEQEGADVDGFIDKLIADFQSANPTITVQRTHYESEALRDQFQTASLGKAPPDVVRVPNDFAGPFSTLDIVAPMDQLFGKDFLVQFLQGSLDPVMVGGRLWGIPDNYGNHLMLIYNKSMLPTPPATFEDLIAIAQKLTTKDVQGFAYNLNEPFWGAGFYGAFGGWPLDANDKPQFNNQAFIDYLTFVAKLKTDGVVPAECDYNCADTLMKDGKAVMIINGDWSLADYTKALGDKMGVAPVPPINGRPFTEMTAGKYFMVAKPVLDDPAKKDAVIRFIAYMTSADVQKKWLDQFKRLPSNIEVAKDPSITSDPILAGSMAALSNGRGQPAAAAMRCAWDAWRPSLEGVMAGTTLPTDAAAAAQASADKCVATLTSP
jgi:arabinogalactan oligomer/maltooligosaccharide transport system substrate-binding protein